MLDPTSPTWAAVKAKADDTIETARQRLSTRGFSQLNSEYERGRIAAMKELLDMAKPREELPFAAPDI